MIQNFKNLIEEIAKPLMDDKYEYKQKNPLDKITKKKLKKNLILFCFLQSKIFVSLKSILIGSICSFILKSNFFGSL
jgi:Ca2+-dependent lipid-binding protein